MYVIDTKARRIRRKIISECTRIIYPFDKYVKADAAIKINQNENGIIFITGAPRTGSTFLYQILTNQLDVVYLSNLSNLFYHSLCTGILLHDKFFGSWPHDSYTSDNGRTRRLIEVNESGKFWYQWYPKSDQIIQEEDLSQEQKEQLQSILWAICNRFKKPLVFKNQHIAHRIGSLAGIFPGSIFIHIKRNPYSTAESIIRHRKRFGGSKDAWYSVKPPQYEEIKNLDYREQVVRQIYGVDQMIEKQLSGLPEYGKLTVDYEQLEENWTDIVEKVYDMLTRFGNVKYREGSKPPVFHKRTKPKQQLDEELNHYIRKVYG